MANFTDFDALEIGGGASVTFIDRPSEVAAADAIIIPGTKNTVADLQWLRRKGLDRAIVDARGKVPIIGVCGGYQMLGGRIEDPNGVEGDEGGSYEGLGLIRSVSRFGAYEKRTVRVEGTMADGEGEVRGYEIHMGATESKESPLFLLRSDRGVRGEGSISPDGMVMGTYVHGLFDRPSFRSRFLSLAGNSGSRSVIDYDAAVEESLSRVARTVEEHLDIDTMLKIMEAGP